MLSLFQRLLLGALLLLALVTGLSLVVRHSFVSFDELRSRQRQIDHALSTLATAQAYLAREQILVERSLLRLYVPPAGAAEPEEPSAVTPPSDVQIRRMGDETAARLDVARGQLAAVPDAPDISGDITVYGRVLARLHRGATDFAARRAAAAALEPINVSLTHKLMALSDQHQLQLVTFERQREGLRTRLISLCGLAILLSIVILGNTILFTMMPLREAARTARRIGQGDLQQRIDWQRSDDLGVLATEFNRMAIRLRDLRETESGRREMEYQLSDAVIQSIFEPVIVTDARGQILRLNASAKELLGEAADNRAALSSTPGGEQVLAAIHRAISLQRTVGGETEAALTPLRIGGSGRNFRLRATPIRDVEGHLLGVVTVLEDVTELQALDRFKTRFLGIASKKLRDPLEKLRIAIHALSRGYAGELRPLQADVLEGANIEAQHMDDLMADLFAVAELDSGNRLLKREALRPIDLLREAQAGIRHAATTAGVTVEVAAAADLRRVEVDRRATRSIFENLLTNAVRYTPRGGSVRLSATEGKHTVQFSVADTGGGIEPERLTRIFERFSSNETDGTGLGLSLVRRLVEAQGGQVSVESRLHAGTTFSFTLPTAAELETRHPVEAG